MKKTIFIAPVAAAAVLGVVIGLGAFSGGTWNWESSTKDNTIKYTLLVGQTDHNDSAARTRGIRDALDTRVEEAKRDKHNPNNEGSKVGHIKLGTGTAQKEYTVVELNAKEQKNESGATWDQATAQKTTAAWMANYRNDLTMIISNNDGMAEGALAAPNILDKMPIFGYDSNASTLRKVIKGTIAGTINSNAPAQTAAICMTARYIMDNPSKTRDEVDEVLMNSISHYDSTTHKDTPTDPSMESGTKTGYGYITKEAPFAYNRGTYSKAGKTNHNSMLVDSFKVDTAKEAEECLADAETQASKVFKQGTQPSTQKNVFLSYYSETDTYINSTFDPLMNVFKKYFKIEGEPVRGNGNDEPVIVQKLAAIGEIKDAYIINLTKTPNAKQYFETLEGKFKKSEEKAQLLQTPFIFFNRQPSGANGVDTEIMNRTWGNSGKDADKYKFIYYIGFDADQGGDTQGKMIVDWLNKQVDEHQK